MVFLQVVIKDIISKSVIAQFKSHKSPISALSFDRSLPEYLKKTNSDLNLGYSAQIFCETVFLWIHSKVYLVTLLW